MFFIIVARGVGVIMSDAAISRYSGNRFFLMVMFIHCDYFVKGKFVVWFNTERLTRNL